MLWFHVLSQHKDRGGASAEKKEDPKEDNEDPHDTEKKEDPKQVDQTEDPKKEDPKKEDQKEDPQKEDPEKEREEGKGGNEKEGEEVATKEDEKKEGDGGDANGSIVAKAPSDADAPAASDAEAQLATLLAKKCDFCQKECDIAGAKVLASQLSAPINL